VCQTDVVHLSRGKTAGVLAAGRFSGRWRYDRTAGRGIALSYDRGVSGPLAARLPDVHAGGRLTGRWRFNRVAGRGIALSYDRILSEALAATRVSEAPAAAPAHPEPISPAATRSAMVRVLCYCGEDFTFEGGEGICPGCGQPAEWPTMGVIEREMRSDLDELLRGHEQGTDPDY
jgi:hypothetical protein